MGVWTLTTVLALTAFDRACAVETAPATNAALTGSAWAFTAPAELGFTDDGAAPRSSLEAFGFTTPMAAKARKHLDAGQKFKQAGQWLEAAAEFRAALQAFPTDASVQIELAEALSLGSNYVAARSLWQRLSARNPRSAWLKARCGGVELRMGETDAAEKSLRDALAIDPTELSARFHLSCLLIARKDVEGARKAIGSLNLLEIGSLATWVGGEFGPLQTLLGADGYAQLCQFVFTGGELPADPSGTLKKTLTPEESRALMTTLSQTLWRGYEALRKGQWGPAETELAAAVRAGLRAPAVLNDIAFCRAQRGEIAKAKEIMVQLVKFYPDSPMVLSKYGTFCLQNGEVPAAVQNLERAHQLQPDQLDTSVTLAGAYAAQGASNSAWNVLNRIPVATRGSLTNWFAQDKPYIVSLRSDPRYSTWLEGK